MKFSIRKKTFNDFFLKMMNASVSVIIPSYNNGQLIEQTLKSLLNQSYSHWECIVVDDGSINETVSTIQKFCKDDSRVKFYHRPQRTPKGANACRNYGYTKSTGKYIQWFDADDLMHPEMLTQKIEKLQNSKADFVVCEGLIFKGSTENIVGKWDQLDSSNPLLDHALGNINFQTNAPMFRRTFLQNKKFWNERLQRKQDYEYFSHLLSYHPKFDIIKNPLFYYRVHAKSMNGQNESKSLTSIVKADALVFQNIKKEAIKMGVQQKVQKHFLRKNISRLRLAVDHNNWRAFFMVIENLVKVLDYLYLKNYFLAKK